MRRIGTLVGAGAALSAVLVCGASAAPRSLQWATFPSDIKGTVFVMSGGAKSSALVSLHDVEPDVAYRVAGNTLPCSTTDGSDGDVWSAGLGVHDDGEIYAAANLAFAKRDLPAIRSMRIYGRRADGSSFQGGCSKSFAGRTGKPPGGGPLGVRCCYTSGTFLRGSIQGIVLVQTSGSSNTATVSLHGVEPNTEYLVTGNMKACSVADAMDSDAWGIKVDTGPGVDDVFAKGVAKVGLGVAGKDLSAVRSIRIYEQRANGSRFQGGCTRGDRLTAAN